MSQGHFLQFWFSVCSGSQEKTVYLLVRFSFFLRIYIRRCHSLSSIIPTCPSLFHKLFLQRGKLVCNTYNQSANMERHELGIGLGNEIFINVTSYCTCVKITNLFIFKNSRWTFLTGYKEIQASATTAHACVWHITIWYPQPVPL